MGRHLIFHLLGMWAAGALLLPPAFSATLLNDPKGFHDIPWGSPLQDRPDMVLLESRGRITEYAIKDGHLELGQAQVESVKFVAIDGKFARVAVWYRGESTHAQVLAYVESRFGPADRAPGAMMRGLNQEFTWLGEETSVSLTYFGAQRQRGDLFIESRVLAPLFMDALGGA
jgi:hypothetical protein